MSRGKIKHTDRPVEWKIMIPLSITEAINATLMDPIKNKPIFGARSKLTQKLYREYLARLEKNVPSDSAVAKALETAKLIDRAREDVTQSLMKLLTNLGYRRTAETFNTLYKHKEEEK